MVEWHCLSHCASHIHRGAAGTKLHGGLLDVCHRVNVCKRRFIAGLVVFCRLLNAGGAVGSLEHIIQGALRPGFGLCPILLPDHRSGNVKARCILVDGRHLKHQLRAVRLCLDDADHGCQKRVESHPHHVTHAQSVVSKLPQVILAHPEGPRINGDFEMPVHLAAHIAPGGYGLHNLTAHGAELLTRYGCPQRVARFARPPQYLRSVVVGTPGICFGLQIGNAGHRHKPQSALKLRLHNVLTHLYATRGAGIASGVVQRLDVELLHKIEQQARFVAAAGVHKHLCWYAVHWVTRAAVINCTNQCLDDAQGVLALGLLVMQIDVAAVVVDDQISQNALPGDLHQFARLVLVVIPLVEQPHGLAAAHAVQHAHRGIYLPCVVRMQAAQ
ncbi:hypothetical protein SDC9_60339 [bioreactor metagenome]|uniref:Uncharacterized protein n=1 Tax=bioreactor metagenome TaxID=1076179 RepID=A0A644XD06_9ZZZZ